MIVPRPRLLFWVGAAGLPLGVLSAAGPSAEAGVSAIAGLFIVVVLADAAWAGRRLAGLAVVLPPVIRLIRDREGAFDVDVRNPAGRALAVRIGLEFPPGIETPRREIDVELPQEGPVVRLAWPCRPRRRGSFRIESWHLECASLLGFWAARRAAPAATEIRVHPDLRAEGRAMAAVFLQRGQTGAHAHRQVGKGREFEKLREYIPGDGLEEIHWKATAKRGRLVTKVFQVERTQEVYVALDASRLSARPSGDPPSPALERYIAAALSLAIAAQHQGDHFGLLTFSDRMIGFVRAGGGRGHFALCRDALLALEPRLVAPDFEEAAIFVRRRLRRRALVVVLTDLDDPVLAEDFTRASDLLRRQHLIMACMLRPEGARPLFSGSEPTDMEDLYRALAGHVAWHHLRELQRQLGRHGVRLSLLDQAFAAGVVSSYLALKQRQAL